MFQPEDIEKLAQLSRVAVSPEEARAFAGEMETIVGYVSEVQSAPDPAARSRDIGDVENVMRPDADSHESGLYTEELLAAAPKSAAGYVVVKKIL